MLHAPPPPAGGRAARGRRGPRPRRARSRWAPTPSRGRWTTSGPRTWSTCPPSGSTPPRSRNGAYAAFVDAGGYDDPRWWSESGWAHRLEAGLVAPQFWDRDGDSWWRRRFGVAEPVPADEPVCHVCFYEAEAYARGPASGCPPRRSGRRPPASTRRPAARGATRGATTSPTPAHANLGQRHLQPAPVGAYPAGASPLGVHQLIGDVWEWTTSGFHPYPGFSAFPYPEYSEVFFGGDYRVLRGGSFGTDAAAIRAHVPQLGPPDPAADLLRLPVCPERGPGGPEGA